ncbi:MAG: type II secretion system protein [Rickettsiales bacterium]|nr:type II secretion system protein [Rickettsiales bacterium]
MNKNKAFSLVELSIVIIIIGLLFTGVAGGSKLIQQAKQKN